MLAKNMELTAEITRLGKAYARAVEKAPGLELGWYSAVDILIR
jgi:hypothetical protein